MAISELEAKKAVPCCSPTMMDVSIMRSSRRAMVCIHSARWRSSPCQRHAPHQPPLGRRVLQQPDDEEEGEGGNVGAGETQCITWPGR